MFFMRNYYPSAGSGTVEAQGAVEGLDPKDRCSSER